MTDNQAIALAAIVAMTTLGIVAVVTQNNQKPAPPCCKDKGGERDTQMIPRTDKKSGKWGRIAKSAVEKLVDNIL